MGGTVYSDPIPHVSYVGMRSEDGVLCRLIVNLEKLVVLVNNTNKSPVRSLFLLRYLYVSALLLHGNAALCMYIYTVPRVHVSPYTKMPHDPGYHQSQSYNDGGPEHRSPARNIPSFVAQSPQGHIEMHDVPDKKWNQQCTNNLLLQGNLGR